MNPSGGCQLPSASWRQSTGMKSHALRGDGGGMPGVSGELNVRAVPTRGGFAKLPGVVPWPRLDGLDPPRGSE
jgi:hypothetical protein